jgi:hypothetical protein
MPHPRRTKSEQANKLRFREKPVRRRHLNPDQLDVSFVKALFLLARLRSTLPGSEALATDGRNIAAAAYRSLRP